MARGIQNITKKVFILFFPAILYTKFNFSCSIDATCSKKALDILLVVDGSGSVREANFDEVKNFIQKVNTKLNIGPGKTQEAFMQFGSSTDTRIEFNLGEKKTLEEVNQGVQKIEYLSSGTATGDALKKSRDKVKLYLA